MGLKIKKISQLDVVEPAYDLSVKDEAHTFGLASGVYVHNSLRVPKQYFGFTDDGAGFNGGESLSIISARYAKMIKRIQNVMIQTLTDAINLILLDRGLDNYINKFKLKMLPPTTSEEVARRENTAGKVQLTSDIMNMLDTIEDPISKLRILKSLLSDFMTDTEVISLLQEEIDKLEKDATPEEAEESDEVNLGDNTEGDSEDSDLAGDLGFTASVEGEEPPTDEGESQGPDNQTLPNPDSLGLDFTDSDNVE